VIHSHKFPFLNNGRDIPTSRVSPDSPIYGFSPNLYCWAQYPLYPSILDVEAIPDLRSATKDLGFVLGKSSLRAFPVSDGNDTTLGVSLIHHSNVAKLYGLVVVMYGDVLIVVLIIVNPLDPRNVVISPYLVDLRRFLNCGVQQNYLEVPRQILAPRMGI
jgi:hypothetical protein